MVGRKLVLLTAALLLAAGALVSTAAAAPIRATDYAKHSHWLSLPSRSTHRVDVFYLYPSAYTKTSPDQPNVCPVERPRHDAGRTDRVLAPGHRLRALRRHLRALLPPGRRQVVAGAASGRARPGREGQAHARRRRRLRLLHQALQPRPPVHPGGALAGLQRDDLPAGAVHARPPAGVPAHDRRLRPRLLGDAEVPGPEPLQVRALRHGHARAHLLEHRGADHGRARPRGAAGRPGHQPDHLDSRRDRGDRGAEPGLDPARPGHRQAGHGRARPHPARARPHRRQGRHRQGRRHLQHRGPAGLRLRLPAGRVPHVRLPLLLLRRAGQRRPAHPQLLRQAGHAAGHADRGAAAAVRRDLPVHLPGAQRPWT